MKIYTSYFARMKKLPANITPISIALKTPPGVTVMEIKQLAPSWSILKEYKEKADEKLYTERYRNEILKKIDPKKLVEYLNRISNGNDVALFCYEKCGSFCHRHIVAEWLNEAGFEVTEWQPE